MNSLQRFDKDGLELIINTETGESFASISGYARMAGLTQQGISKRASKPDNCSKIKTAEIPTTTGVKTHNLITENLIVEWLPRDNPEMASKLMQLGVRKFLHTLAGFEPEDKKPKTYLEALKELVKTEEERIRLEEEKKLLELERGELLKENHHLSEAVDELFDYSSIIRIAKYNNISETNFKWRVLKAASKNMNKEIKRVPDPRFEHKCLYSHDVWRFCYPKAKLPETTTLVIK